jgi:hypothetical protein
MAKQARTKFSQYPRALTLETFTLAHQKYSGGAEGGKNCQDKDDKTSNDNKNGSAPCCTFNLQQFNAIGAHGIY